MKYNISGFSQLGMIELGLNADDLNILRWFMDFKDSGTIPWHKHTSESTMPAPLSYSAPDIEQKRRRSHRGHTPLSA